MHVVTASSASAWEGRLVVGLGRQGPVGSMAALVGRRKLAGGHLLKKPACHELLMMVIRSAQVSGALTAPQGASSRRARVDAFEVQAAQEFAGEVAAGRVPSVRAIRVRLHVGQPRAQRLRAHLAALGRTEASVA